MKKLFLILVFTISLSVFSQCWQSVTAGGNFTIAIKIDGTLWGSGYNDNGQLGNGNNTNTTQFVQISNSNEWQSVVASKGSFVIAKKNDGTLWGWGVNGVGQIGDGTTINRNVPTPIGTNIWKSFSCGTAFTLAIKIDGTLWAWGNNYYGQLGDGTIVNKLIPTQIGTDTDWQIISSNTQHTLAIKNNGTLWSWGYNNGGQLGNGTFGVINGTPNANLYSAIPTQVGTDSDWAKVAACYNSSIAIKQNGTLWTWGSNNGGQLGDGSGNLSPRNIPLQSGTDTNWLDVQAGQGFVQALKADNTLWAWGGNSGGGLGVGNTTDQYFPVQVSYTPLSATTFQNNTFTIFPNPTKNNLNITTTATLQKTVIYNLLGAKVYEQPYNETIDVSSFVKGMYIVKFYNNDNAVFVEKFVKE